MSDTLETNIYITIGSTCTFVCWGREVALPPLFLENMLEKRVVFHREIRRNFPSRRD